MEFGFQSSAQVLTVLIGANPFKPNIDLSRNQITPKSLLIAGFPKLPGSWGEMLFHYLYSLPLRLFIYRVPIDADDDGGAVAVAQITWNRIGAA